MPLDGRTFQIETRHDVFSLEGLIAWLETQDPGARYEFYCRRCLLGRYFEDACGKAVRDIGMGSVTLSDGFHMLPKGWNLIALMEPRTYGAALGRARKLLAKSR